MKEDYDQAITTTARHPTPPSPPRWVYAAAVVYMNLQELELARSDVEHALALDPNNALALTLRGELLSLRPAAWRGDGLQPCD
jgi:Flp pilus assembly protein TadD